MKEKLLSSPYEVCIERARLYTRSYQETEGQPSAIRAAKALAKTLAEMTICIWEEELIVGNRTSKRLAGVIPVERGDINAVLEMDMDTMPNRKRPFMISEDDRRALREQILPYWKGKTIRDKKATLWAERGLMKVKLLGEIGRNCPNLATDIFDVQGHLVLGHENVMRQGFSGIKKRAKEHLEKLRTENPDESRNADFLQAVIICSEGAIAFAHRFAGEAMKLAEKEADPRRRDELLRIADNCRWVPANPPRRFYEAMQCLWFTQVIAQISYGMAGTFALGRVDQYLYPFYKRDVEQGIITKDEALELIEELELKLTSNILLLPELGLEVSSTLGTSPQPITIGGLTKDGKDATNELSWMILESSEKLKAVINNLAIRIHSKTAEDFMLRACRVYRSTSGQAFYNDEAIIPALLSDGYSLEDARDYAIVGCVEPTGSGDTFACTGGNDIKLAGVLEMVLTNGGYRLMGGQGLPTGDPTRFETFDEVMDAFRRQLEHNVKMAVDAVNIKDAIYQTEFPAPFVSATLTGCVESGRDATDGGARYNFGSITARGLGTTTDSLAAIKKLVFDDQVLTMSELVELLETNFEGKDELRHLLINRAPKYGNDDDYVDLIAKEIAELFCREVTEHQSIRGGHFRPSFYSYGTHVLDGQFLGATPDGRMAGEAISNGISPANAREKKGPTAVLNSAAKLEHTLISNGNSLNLRLLPSLVQDEAALGMVASLVKTYFHSGGMHLQFNVVSRETLVDAQKNPQDYRDLVVRVSGYSAFFTDLGKLIQDDIIARTEFGP
ncbi:MAG: formate C-acetyltransferase/glycerol dehydratase family glycyl radical enzyme [Dehalococcoidia bacterium]|nr:formate C-acetyltransferase/glycerol dehydratase family glycyl radical enzyme [Dehalococcoidia bacterium]